MRREISAHCETCLYKSNKPDIFKTRNNAFPIKTIVATYFISEGGQGESININFLSKMCGPHDDRKSCIMKPDDGNIKIDKLAYLIAKKQLKQHKACRAT
ncbi:hypothetical protein L6164_032371 [Bauhinia variegata]|uniref:Uncharacterized protein n=1 Tax=Bauhinia variegata TaxID=167791 RepID=A0ACB9KNC3_BAUVA|nr:hypothetical protein L6164_032371 [Bauhinia variegata]